MNTQQMNRNSPLMITIKQLVHNVAPNAKVIVYGSYARGEQTNNSDIDLLILLDKNTVTFKEEQQIKSPLYDLEFETGQIISPLILSQIAWEQRHRITPFYDNVSKEGIEL